MKFGVFLLFFFLFSINSFGQKAITLAEAEDLLQKNNLLLLAEQYNITASQASVIQAKIWEQPYFVADLNLINPQDNKFFDVGRQGQKAFAIGQLIYLGGKKKNEVNYAKSNVEIAKLEFEQLLRNLKYQLKLSFYNIYFDKQSIKNIETQSGIIDTLVYYYNIQANKGNIPLSEVVRLQALSINLRNQKNSLLKNIVESEQNLALLLGIQETISPIVNEEALLQKNLTTNISIDSLQSIALESNVEFLTSQKVIESQQSYLKWQKSLATPDLTTGLAYDQRGGAFLNQVNLTLGIPLPFWNKNKGTIKIAEAQLQQSTIQREYKKQELENRVVSLWTLWNLELNQYKKIDKKTTDNLNQVYKGTIDNFQKRNLKMIEFTDFMESYNQTVIQINEIKKSFIQSGLNLNYITNKEIF